MRTTTATTEGDHTARLIAAVRRLAALKGYTSERQLALKAGIDVTTLNRKLKGGSRLTFDDQVLLATALDMLPSELAAEAEVTS